MPPHGLGASRNHERSLLERDETALFFDDLVTVLRQARRLDAARNRLPAVKEEDSRGGDVAS
jgi:hypothetical protein